MSRDEIIKLVKGNQSAVVWITSQGAIVYRPHQHVGLIANVGTEFFNDDFPVPRIIIDGLKGLSALDPEWDGADLFRCQNPACHKVHPSDWNRHDHWWRKNA